MKIVSLVLHGDFTDGMAYQENCLPNYQKKVWNAEVVIVAGQYKLEMGTNKSVIEPIGESICENGIRLLRIHSTKNKLARKFAYYPTLLKTLENEKPDYIFAHLVQSISLPALKKYKKKHPEVKIFADSHADYINSAHNWISKNILHKIIWKNVLNFSLDSIEMVYGVLPARVDFLKQVYKLPENKVQLLLMGAEDDKIHAELAAEYRMQIRKKLAIAESDFVIITGGKIDPKKNIKILTDVLSVLNLEKIKLIIFGKANEEMKEYIETIQEEAYVRYVGWLSSEEMYKYFHASDLAVFPGTHSVIWEQAVGTGLPGIYRRWEGIEHIDRGGNIEFINGESEEELRTIIQKISCNSEKYAEMKEKAEAVKSDFLYSNIALKSLSTNSEKASK